MPGTRDKHPLTLEEIKRLKADAAKRNSYVRRIVETPETR